MSAFSDIWRIATTVCFFGSAGWVRDAVNVSHAVADFVAIGGSGWAAALGGGSAWTRSRGFAQCPVGDRAGGWSELEQYWNFDYQSYQHVWSVTKSILSALVGIALSEGILTSVDQKLARCCRSTGI
jgi:hypothetical protein